MNSHVTVIHLGSAHVRVSEQIGEASELLALALTDPSMYGFAPFTDPGDERAKLIRADRVLWLEMEAGSDDS